MSEPVAVAVAVYQVREKYIYTAMFEMSIYTADKKSICAASDW